MTQQIARFGTLTADDEFNVDWQDPEEAKFAWVWDPGHFPYPITPLGIDLQRRSAVAVQDAMGVPEALRPPVRHINGYRFQGQPPGGGELGSRSMSTSDERKRQILKDAKDPWGNWKREWEPEIRGLLEPLKTDDLASVPLSDLADRLDTHFMASGRGTSITMSAAQVLFAASDPFLEFCKEEFGAEGELRSATMLSGYANYSTASERAVWNLAVRLLDAPDPTQALKSLKENLDKSDSELARMANKILDRWGLRAAIWGDIATPSWRVDPTAFFETLERYIEELPENPRIGTRRAAERRRREIAKARAEFSGEKLEKFNSLLEAASIYVPLREARAYWQMASLGIVGVPARAVGERLVDAGVINEVEDVFYLELDDIREATSGSSGRDWSALVVERRVAHERNLTIVPPVTVGAPFEGSKEELLGRAGKFRGTESDDDSGDANNRMIIGTAVSRGTVRGVARVIRSLDEGHRLKEGEILVCRTSSPPWTPLIARSAGVIAETGGVLMHCAIVTREYAIPCVVGVGPVDGLIEDGDTITIDGTQGIVRVE